MYTKTKFLYSLLPVERFRCISIAPYIQENKLQLKNLRQTLNAIKGYLYKIE